MTADGEEDLLNVALREVKEETGLDVKVLDDNIFAINALSILGHIKREKYVSAHIHFDVVYLLEADDTLPLIYREDESKGVKWVDFENATDERIVDFIRSVHNKLIKKLEYKK